MGHSFLARERMPPPELMPENFDASSKIVENISATLPVHVYMVTASSYCDQKRREGGKGAVAPPIFPRNISSKIAAEGEGVMLMILAIIKCV